MLHFDRTWCVAQVETPQELAEKLRLMRWCCCMAFQIEGHLNCFWLNDSESPEATQEYAAIVQIGPNGKRVQLESIMVGFCTEAELLRSIRKTLKYKGDPNFHLCEISLHLQTPKEHAQCEYCA